MATSESDDFESADEELAHNVTSKTNVEDTRWSGMQSVVDSESDDDTECIPQLPRKNILIYEKPKFRSFREEVASGEEKLITLKGTPTKDINQDEKTKVSDKKIQKMVPSTDAVTETTVETSAMGQENSTEVISESTTTTAPKEERLPRPRRSADGPRKLAVRKLGTKIEKESEITLNTIDNIKENVSTENVISKEITKELNVVSDVSSNADLSEVDMPEELKSNKKFKEIFKPQGWEKIGNNIELVEDLTEQKIQPVLDRLSINDDNENSLWANWGSWGVSSLINTASAGVSTLTTHVSQGLSLLEETINVPDTSQLQMIQDTREEVVEKEEVTIPGIIYYYYITFI